MKNKNEGFSSKAGIVAALVVAVFLGLLLFFNSDLNRQVRTVVGMNEPINVTSSNFGCNPSGSWSGTVWCDYYGGTYETHKLEAQKHQGKVVFFKVDYKPGVPSYYRTGSGDYTNNSSANGLNGNAIVRCPSGTSVSAVHLRNHQLYSPNLGEGFYDGASHYYCADANGVGFDPIPGLADYRVDNVPDAESNVTKLFKYWFSNGAYYKSSAGSWSSCPSGTDIVGPYIEGDKLYYSPYGAESEKINHYHCYSNVTGTFAEPISGSSPPSPFSTVNYAYSPSTCPDNDSSCGGASTYGATTVSCSRNTSWCQTNDPAVRYCADGAGCLTANYIAPGPSWTFTAPSNLYLANTTKTSFSPAETIMFSGKYAVTGTPPSGKYLNYSVTVGTNASNITGSSVWNKSYTSTSATSGSFVTGSYPGDGTLPIGSYYWCMQFNAHGDEGTPTSCVAGPAFNIVPPAVATCSLGLTLNDGKTSYVQGDMVNYTYSCSPVGSTAANVTVQVVKPDGTATTYNTGTNIGTSTLGFSTSNLTAGVYTLRACLSSTCTTGVASATFTVTGTATTTPTTTTTTTGTGCGVWDVCNYSSGDWCASGTSCASVSNSNQFTCLPVGTSCSGYGLTAPTSTSGSSTTNTTTTIPTAPKACGVGETCSSGSWCNNGKQCYYPDSKLTCVAWGNGGPSPSCPSGTSSCSPGDANCIEPGQYGSTNGWCSDSMECFVDGRKFCQPWSNDPMGGPPQCPAGAQICSPTDTNCGEPGKTYTTNIDQIWCKNSMSCYAKDKSNVLCYSNPNMMTPAAGPMTPGSMSCPSGYTQCRPGDKGCTAVGETNTDPGAWCSGGQQCYLTSGALYCADWNASCPKDSGVCRAGDTNCIEPGKTGSIDGWCGGSNSVQCYADSGKDMLCKSVNTSNDPQAWEKVACGAGYSRCRPNDTYCLGELGATGPSGSWCTVGRSEYQTDGSVKCVAWENITPATPATPVISPRLPVSVCIDGFYPSYNPTSFKCENFANSCDVKAGWSPMKTGFTCMGGSVVTIDEMDPGQANGELEKVIRREYQYLGDTDRKLTLLPPRFEGEVTVLRLKVSEASETLKGLLNTKDTKFIKEKFSEYNTKSKPDIETWMAKIGPVLEWVAIRKDIIPFVQSLNIELGRIDSSTDYFTKLGALTKRLEGLIDTIRKESSIENIGRIITPIRDTKIEIDNLRSGHRTNQGSVFIEITVQGFVSLRDSAHNYIALNSIDDAGIQFALDRLDAVISEISTSQNMDNTLRLLDKGNELSLMLKKLLAPKGFRSDNFSLETLFTHVDTVVSAKVNEMFANLENTMAIMLDSAIAKAVEKVAKIMTEFEIRVGDAVQQHISTAVANLTSVHKDVRDEIVAAKNTILETWLNMENALKASSVPSFTANDLRGIMEDVAVINWCGSQYNAIKAAVNSAGLAIETDDFTTVDADALRVAYKTAVAENNRECYRIGASRFSDTPMHEWYFGYTQFNGENGYIRGYKDEAGHLTGESGPGNSTLKIEAATIFARLLGAAEADGGVAPAGLKGVPEWGYGVMNGIRSWGYEPRGDWNWADPISRIEAAELLHGMLVNAKYIVDPVYIIDPIHSEAASEYTDYSEFKGSVSANAVADLTEVGIFTGNSDGSFGPYDGLARAAFGALNQRVFNTYVSSGGDAVGQASGVVPNF